MLAEARRRHPRLPLLQGDAHDLPLRSHAVDLSVFVITLEFVERPVVVLAEAVRVARQGALVVALNRRSLGGFSRRWGPDANRSLLGRALDFTLAFLRALASPPRGRGSARSSGRAPCLAASFEGQRKSRLATSPASRWS